MKHSITQTTDSVPFHVLDSSDVVVARAYTLRDAKRMQRALNAGTADPRLLNA